MFSRILFFFSCVSVIYKKKKKKKKKIEYLMFSKNFLLSEEMCQSNQYSKCSWMSEYTTNLTKILAGRFSEHILTKNPLKMQFCDFFAKNLRRTEVTQHFASMLCNFCKMPVKIDANKEIKSQGKIRLQKHLEKQLL